MLKKAVLLSMLIASSAHAENLPNYQVGVYTFNQKPVEEVVSTLVQKTGISVDSKNMDPSNVITAKSVKGSLPVLMDKLSKSANFKYAFDGKTLSLDGGYIAPKDDVSFTTEYRSAQSSPIQQPIQSYRKSYEILSSDKTLSESLKRWAKEEGWSLVWDAPFDFPFAAYSRYDSDFQSALSKIVDGLKSSENPIKVTFYTENKVLRVTSVDGDE